MTFLSFWYLILWGTADESRKGVFLLLNGFPREFRPHDLRGTTWHEHQPIRRARHILRHESASLLRAENGQAYRHEKETRILVAQTSMTPATLVKMERIAVGGWNVIVLLNTCRCQSSLAEYNTASIIHHCCTQRR